MLRITVDINGMACAMCESHVNEAIRKALPVKKVSASHSKGTAVILSEAPLDEGTLRRAIDETGYKALDVSAREAEKKRGLFGLFK